jgi:hypothetical protein
VSASAVWSLIMFATTTTGLLIGRHNPRWGWVYGIGHQFLWCAEGFATGRVGDILTSLVFWAVYLSSLHKWRGTRFVPVAQREPAAEPVCASCAAHSAADR